MNNKTKDFDVLQKKLELSIEDICTSIIDSMTYIRDNSYSRNDNFTELIYILTDLEDLEIVALKCKEILFKINQKQLKNKSNNNIFLN